MLGVGWTEMLVIGVVALIIIGPKDLPMVMQRVGKFAGMIRRMGTEFQRELNKTTGLNEVRNLRDSITAPLRQTADEIRREFNATTASGQVEPTGAIAPKDPKAESIVDEIHAAAGMKPPEASVAPVVAEPIKGARLSPIPPSHVTAKDLDAVAQPAAEAKPARKSRAKKPAAPAPAEAPVTAKKAEPKKAAPKTAPKAAAKPAASKTADVAPKTPAKPKVAAKPKAAAKPKVEAVAPNAEEKP